MACLPFYDPYGWGNNPSLGPMPDFNIVATQLANDKLSLKLSTPIPGTKKNWSFNNNYFPIAASSVDADGALILDITSPIVSLTGSYAAGIDLNIYDEAGNHYNPTSKFKHQNFIVENVEPVQLEVLASSLSEGIVSTELYILAPETVQEIFVYGRDTANNAKNLLWSGPGPAGPAQEQVPYIQFAADLMPDGVIRVETTSYTPGKRYYSNWTPVPTL